MTLTAPRKSNPRRAEIDELYRSYVALYSYGLLYAQMTFRVLTAVAKY